MTPEEHLAANPDVRAALDNFHELCDQFCTYGAGLIERADRNGLADLDPAEIRSEVIAILSQFPQYKTPCQ